VSPSATAAGRRAVAVNSVSAGAEHRDATADDILDARQAQTQNSFRQFVAGHRRADFAIRDDCHGRLGFAACSALSCSSNSAAAFSTGQSSVELSQQVKNPLAL